MATSFWHPNGTPMSAQQFMNELFGELPEFFKDEAEKSDLFDVLAYVAYTLPPLTLKERANKAKVIISTQFNTKQQVFLDFVLSHYVSVGVDALAQEKLVNYCT